MQYRQANKNDSANISELSSKEIGWSNSREHLEGMLEDNPAEVALDGEKLCGFIYTQPIASDVLRVCNFIVNDEDREQGIGKELLSRLEKQASEAGYRAVLFPEDPEWFEAESIHWFEDQGYEKIYQTDKSRIVVKETALA
jgi:N-acetylglutamate synthase-like GNAT family acetyltransferase